MKTEKNTFNKNVKKKQYEKRKAMRHSVTKGKGIGKSNVFRFESGLRWWRKFNQMLFDWMVSTFKWATSLVWNALYVCFLSFFTSTNSGRESNKLRYWSVLTLDIFIERTKYPFSLKLLLFNSSLHKSQHNKSLYQYYYFYTAIA